MKRFFHPMLVLMAGAVLAGCETQETTEDSLTAMDTLVTEVEQPTGTASIQVTLRAPDGTQLGTATLRQAEGGVEISLEAQGLPAGEHGFHIHETGGCEAPDFASAGGHFNPTEREHGFDAPAGPHAGDLRNITVQEDGTVTHTTLAENVTLQRGQQTSLLRDGGTALVIHAGPDDYTSQPSGDAGARLACGVIEGS
ncbi:MAG: superoxide dismutase family protein [Gemmatimonadota bacterium]